MNTKKSNLHYTRGTASKRVTSGGVHLHDLASGPYNSEETSQRWRADGNTAYVSTGRGMKPRPPASIATSLDTTPTIVRNYTIN